MTSIPGYVIVFLGAGIGGALRHGANRLIPASHTAFPWSTLLVNVSGSFVMGLIAGWFAFRNAGHHPMLPLFLTTGILGGYTTFSAFSLDAALLWDRGDVRAAAFYVLASVILSIVGLFVGLSLMRP